MFRSLCAAIAFVLLAGCARSIPVAAVASLGRGISRTQVEDQLGRSGECTCRLSRAGKEYEIFRYGVGQYGEPYVFVYEDNRLIKICAKPVYWRDWNSSPTTEPGYYLLARADGLIESAPDVRPPDEQPDKPTDPVYVVTGVVVIAFFAAFVVIESPILIAQMLGRKEIPVPGDIQLGETAGQIQSRFGKAQIYTSMANGDRWRHYAEDNPHGPYANHNELTILLRKGKVVAVFNQYWMDDHDRVKSRQVQPVGE